jgi:3'-5' exoribonuclease
LYLQVELADRSGTITGRMWNASDEHFEAFSEGDYVRVAGTTQLYSGALQVILTEVDQVDPTRVDETAFRVLTQDAVAQLRQELNDFSTTLQESLPKLLFEEVLSDVGLMEAFERCPAGIKHHHAYAGGLLQHVVMLLRLADRVA